MQWLLLSLLASLCGVLASAEAPIANTSIDASGIFDVLYPRVEIGPGGSAPSANIEDLFDLLDSCKGKRDVVQGWLAEVKKLHSVFERASREATDIPPYAVIFDAMFGTMPFHAFVKDPDTMELVKARIAGVTQFLNGGGLRKSHGRGKPKLSCSGSDFELQDPSGAVKDRNNKYVVTKMDPETKEPLEYLDFYSAFPSVNWGSQRVFWCKGFNGYVFAKNDAVCGGNTAGCVAPKPAAYSVPRTARNFKLGKVSRLMVLCERAFEAQRDRTHSFPSLTEAVSADNYPSGDLGKPEYRLDRMVPMSATFYHELYHLTDMTETGESDTMDLSYVLKEILEAAEDEGLLREANTKNPETYVFAAVATYLYLNGPVDDKRVVYIRYRPELESAMFGSRG